MCTICEPPLYLYADHISPSSLLLVLQVGHLYGGLARHIKIVLSRYCPVYCGYIVIVLCDSIVTQYYHGVAFCAVVLD